MAAPCARLQLMRGPVRKGGVARPLNSGVSLQMNQPPDPPPPPKFERPSDDWWLELTEEDREFLEQAQREGRLSHMTVEWALAELEAERKRFHERLRRGGFDPDEMEKG